MRSLQLPSLPDQAEGGADSAAPAPANGDRGAGSGADGPVAATGQTTSQNSSTTQSENTIALESFQTDCHIVRVYRQDETLRMSVLPRSDDCQIVSGDYPATTSSGVEGTEYLWEQQGTQVRAFIPNNEEDPNALEFSGNNVPGGIQVEYAEEEPPPSVDPPSNDLDYQNGFDRGYRRGYQDGQRFRRTGAGYNPDQAFQDVTSSGNPAFDRGFQEGFFDGFEDGYYSLTGDISPPAATSLTCVGQVGISEFAVYYSRESGFSRAEFRPRGTSATLSAFLTYDGINAQGQRVWRGSVNNMADVTVIHLSTQQQPSEGDAVLVNYAGQEGRGICRAAIYGWW